MFSRKVLNWFSGREMKTLILLFFLLLAPAFGRGVPAYSAAWLEKGCIAILVAEKDRENWSDEQKFSLAVTATWIRGYFAGMSESWMAGISGERDVHGDLIRKTPEKWNNTNGVAKELLAFFNEQKDLIDANNMSASSVMTAWYMSNHPDASAGEKKAAIQGLKMLKDKVPPVAKPVRRDLLKSE
jgi:hypothetical protein